MTPLKKCLVIAGVATALLLVTSNHPCAAADTEAKVEALGRSAATGERQALRNLFALRPKADGAVAECIDTALGSTISGHPQLFLEELKRSGQHEGLDGLLGGLGSDFVDNFPKQVQELRERKRALESVRSEALVGLRDKCVGILELEIQRMNKPPQLDGSANRSQPIRPKTNQAPQAGGSGG
jgi:hypothetical protein